MASAEVQALLRFLTQESKLPLTIAMSKVKELREAKLLTPEDLSKANIQTFRSIFTDEKTAKQVSNAAMRTVKKRSADSNLNHSPKKRKSLNPELVATPSQVESTLALPINTDMDEISTTVVLTNRAPLVLAFAFMVIKYTMPEQPPSSRLSLAQAVVSANSRTKAVNIGLESKPSAQDEGLAKGQPTVKILGREISILKRWDYVWKRDQSDSAVDESCDEPNTKGDSDAVITRGPEDETPPALWGLDLEALRKSNAPPAVSGSHHGGSSTLPIYRAEPARDYLLRAFTLHENDSVGAQSSKKNQKISESTSAKEKCLGMLLGSIDVVCKSWASTLGREELDRRAWAWYVAVRPEVQNGVSGWGQKGPVPLSKILELRRDA